MIEIHILYNIKEGPWGGGNQFLKALKEEFKRKGVYEDSAEKAQIILFNSNHSLKDVLKLKTTHPSKILIHRLGPIFYYHRGGKWKAFDQEILKLTNKISDGVVFQSIWAWQEAMKLGLDKRKPYKIIYNAVDPNIFNKSNKKVFKPEKKIRLITTSWSSNWNKGFEIYKYLDEKLDFSKYEMTFFGNSLIEFKNIKWIKPVPSEKLAEILKQHDIYIFASKLEACSNSLIEAISCGLPAVAINSSSNPELVKEGGELFNGRGNVIEKIEKVTENYNHYQSKIPEFSIEKTAVDYYEFAQKIYEDVQNGKYKPKQVNLLIKINFYKMKVMILNWKIKNKIEAVKRKIWKT